MTLIVAGTGHRPESCEDEDIVRLKARVKLQYSGATGFITGMSSGYDLWAGDEARLLGLEVWCAKPWTGHKPRNKDSELYDTLVEYASRVVNVDESDKYPGPKSYHDRNHWMVDNCTHVMAYLNPQKDSGGTFQCVKYAKSIGKPVANIWFDPPF